MSDATHPNWREDLAEALTDPGELCRLLDLPPTIVDAAAAAVYPLCVPRPFVRRMRPGDQDDPLLRQILPVTAERDDRPGYSNDPLDEASRTTDGGLLQKYNGRLLILTAGGCAVHCRFCFRRHFPRVANGDAVDQCCRTVERLSQDTTLSEVILSGGDPLLLEDEQLAAWIDSLAGVPTLARIRIHTRAPIVIPDRVTDRLLTLLRAARQPIYIILHVNHAREVDEAVRESLRRLRAAGAVLMSHTVLLRGVNDTAEVLFNLFESLANQQVVPYYLHRLDRVAGAAHFAVDDARAVALVHELRRRLPGYAVPRYVAEIPGATHKTPMC